jgi:hypothetical protein
LAVVLTAVASGTWLRSSCSVRALADECVGSLTSPVPLNALNRSPGQTRLEVAFRTEAPMFDTATPALLRAVLDDLCECVS